MYVCVYCVSILYCVLCGSGDYRLPPLGIWSRAWEWINPWRSCSQTNYWFFTARADEKTQGIDTPERKETQDTKHLCFGNCSIPIPTQRAASGRIYPREARTRRAKEQFLVRRTNGKQAALSLSKMIATTYLMSLLLCKIISPTYFTCSELILSLWIITFHFASNRFDFHPNCKHGVFFVFLHTQFSLSFTR